MGAGQPADRGRLPVVGQSPPERRDAARSRQRILAAARRLLQERGVQDLTMNEVAAAAGVGVGTVYRRFADVSALLHAVLDDQERDLQEQLLSGEPPFHPDAPPMIQVVGLLHRYLDYLESNAELLYAADTAVPGGRLHWGSYQVYRSYLATRLAAANPALDAEYTADLLLAALDAELYVTQRRDRGMSPAQIKAALASVAYALGQTHQSGR